MNIKVVERAGTCIRNMLPGLTEKECSNDSEQCFIHKNGGKGNCRVEGVVYKSECLTCQTQGLKSMYFGETSRSGFQRGKQHQEAIKQPHRNRHNAFGKHISEYHQENGNAQFKTSIIGHFKRPMQRQISEGVHIYRYKSQCDILMNSKTDHFQPAVARVHITNTIE